MHSPLRTLTSLALSAALLAGSGMAHAQSVPPGWVFQGTWHDGHWDGQWVPGGAPGGAPGMMPQGPMPQGPYAPEPVLDRHTRHMLDHCHDDHYAHGCDRFFHDHPEYAPGYAAQQPPYGMPPMGQMPYGAAPMAYTMVPVMVQPAPYTETHTTTTTYVTDHVVHYHHARPHHSKIVYTGS